MAPEQSYSCVSGGFYQMMNERRLSKFCGRQRNTITLEQIFFWLVCTSIRVNCNMYHTYNTLYTILSFLLVKWKLHTLFSEPPRHECFVRNQPLADAFKLFGISASKQEIGLAGLPEQLQSLLKDRSEFAEKMKSEPLSVEKGDLVKVEDFTPLSGLEIDGESPGPHEDHSAHCM